MALNVGSTIDEGDIGDAIRRGDLRLEHILQFALASDRLVDVLIQDMKPLGGTAEAGARAARFAKAMMES